MNGSVWDGPLTPEEQDYLDRLGRNQGMGIRGPVMPTGAYRTAPPNVAGALGRILPNRGGPTYDEQASAVARIDEGLLGNPARDIYAPSQGAPLPVTPLERAPVDDHYEPYAQNTPRSSTLGTAADALRATRDALDRVQVPVPFSSIEERPVIGAQPDETGNVPTVRRPAVIPMGDALLGRGPDVLDRASYGYLPRTAAERVEALDLLGVGDLAGGAGLVLRGAVRAAAPAARAIARDLPVVLADQAGAAGRRVPVTRSTQLPDISKMPADEAIRVARREPHLIQSGDQSEGFYVGGPRTMQSRADLRRTRRDFDAYVAADPRGADWYDRYRAGVSSVTGNQPRDNAWMSAQHGQWSAGVSPDSELAFVLRENNGSIAGMPQLGHYPAQSAAHRAALELNDPRLYQLGEKTGEYARLVNPDQPRPPGATGVNDFRHARNFRYTEPDGTPQGGTLSAAQHRFLDYETALAVDRANRTSLGGRTDWTGERLQAAPWVRQKALAILEQQPALVRARMPEAERMLAEGYGAGARNRPTAAQLAHTLAYPDAFERANRTITDFFPKHTAFGTHEAMVGPNTGHLPGSVNATSAERAAFSTDPRSLWNNAPGGRDAIYSGLRVGETGNAMRVLPTQDMQGLYQPPGGLLEANPGQVARPLVGFEVGPGGTKSITPADRGLLGAGEATRAFIDAQDAGAAHKVWSGGRAQDSNSVFLPMNRPATTDELMALRQVGERSGLGDVVDTGQGVTATQFYPGPPVMTPRGGRQTVADLRAALPDATDAYRVKVDAVYEEFVDQWREGAGSGAATRKLLERLNVTPQMRAAFDNNPYIPSNALARMARDEEWAARWGATRQDIQNARRIIGEGPGWIGRLEEGLRRGAVLPAIAGGIFVAAAAAGGGGGGGDAGL